MTDKKIKLIFISGAGRSGSTLLGLLMQQVPGLCHVGELCHIWSRGFSQNELCSCGIGFRSCPFWTQVASAANLNHVDARQIRKEAQSIQRYRCLPKIIWSGVRSSKYQKAFDRQVERLTQLYESIANAAGTNAIVDSSKNPLYALIATQIPTVELHIIHLIRDSRAVAYSWQRLKETEARSKERFMSIKSPFKSAWAWNQRNALSQYLRRSAASYQRVRYEDLVSDVQSNVGRLLNRIDVQIPPGCQLDITTNRGHIVGGNPVRFQKDRIVIRIDNEWQSRMKKKQKLLITALTLPLMKLYGYRL